jgi:hypothetical protein
VFGYAPHPLQPAAAAAGCEQQKSKSDVSSDLMHILFQLQVLRCKRVVIRDLDS